MYIHKVSKLTRDEERSKSVLKRWAITAFSEVMHVVEREIERERERERDRQTETDRDRQTETDRQRQTDRDRQRQTEAESSIVLCRAEF